MAMHPPPPLRPLGYWDRQVSAELRHLPEIPFWGKKAGVGGRDLLHFSFPQGGCPPPGPPPPPPLAQESPFWGGATRLFTRIRTTTEPVCLL